MRHLNKAKKNLIIEKSALHKLPNDRFSRNKIIPFLFQVQKSDDN